MKRHQSLLTFSREHHTALLLAQTLKKDAPQYRGMPAKIPEKIEYLKAKYNTELKKHFHAEENILFPFLTGKNNLIDELIDDLIRDHNKVAENIVLLETHPDSEKLLDDTARLLECHIRKEERVLFQKIQEVLSDEELNELEKLMK
jgi:iron-sulfur cluster repair protein YtfE (RIC family)